MKIIIYSKRYFAKLIYHLKTGPCYEVIILYVNKNYLDSKTFSEVVY